MGVAIPLSDGDLHGLVDGRLDPARRADALRALASAPAERAKVEAWQEQNDLIRATFAMVEEEPLPPSMRLVAPPALHCIPSPVTPRAQPVPTRPRRHLIVGTALVLVVMSGLGASWLLLQQSDEAPQIVDLDLRGPVEATLASSASEAVARGPERDSAAHATAAVSSSAPLPTTTIPDLSAAGFAFTSAETRAQTPVSLVFHYADRDANRVVVSVAQADGDSPIGEAGRTLVPVGKSLVWRQGATAYAVAGTIEPERLRTIAALVRGGALGGN